MALAPASSRGSSLPTWWTVVSTANAELVTFNGSVQVFPLTDPPGNAVPFEVFVQDASGGYDNIYVWAYAAHKYGIQVTESEGQLGLWIDGTGSWIQRADFLHGWGITPAGQEVLLAAPTPADGDITASQLFSVFDATNGAAKHVRKAKTADGTVVYAVSPMAPAITSGALPTVALVSGTGTQIALNRDARTVTPVTFNPTGAATATCVVAISPDNVTYSTLVTKTFPVSVTLAGSIDEVTVIVPAGWYLKLTATNATLGTTTYY